MNLNVMKFKNFIWPHNPSTINISAQKNLKEVAIPFKGSIIQDYGREKRIVSGSGQFFGDSCIEQFDMLFLVFKQRGSGYLSLPGMDSFLAVFKELKLVGNLMPNVLTYSFEFWEEFTDNTINLDLQNNYYTALAGETLWSIASKFEIPIETLLALNTNIKSHDQIIAGKKVKLR